MSEVHYRTCNLCEAVCGIEIKHENGKILSIAGDKQDPFSRGHICPKAVALKDIDEDTNRLKFPVKRNGDVWQQLTWPEAFSEIAARINETQNLYGRNAVAVYQGNPSVHNLGTMLNGRELLKALKTKNTYSATSVDQLPHHFAGWAMFGHPLLIPIPDIDHTDYFLMLGANPLASNGSLMTSPDVVKRLEAVKARGKVVVLDPRRTETARVASEHFFIKPASDVYFLLSVIHTLFTENLVRLGRLEEFTDGLEMLRTASKDYAPERVENLTGIPAPEIKRIATEFAAAKRAVCYGRIGVSVQKFGGLCHWLINSINILTGNFDRQGGAMFTLPAFDLLMMAKGDQIFNRWQSRVRGLPEFMGELPVAALAEEILTDGDGQIKALITNCGNPVLSTPNGTQLDQALEKLDFMVAIDIYINETTRHADIILPPATGVENSHYDVIFNSLAVRNVAKYSEPLFPKAEGAKYDWEILQELAHRLSGRTEPLKLEPPEVKLDLGLRYGRYKLTLDDLRSNPHGLDLGELKSCLPERLLTQNKRIDLAPACLIKDLERLKAEDSAASEDYPFILIGRRHLRDNNSWLHNSERLLKGKNRCTLLINSTDAQNLNMQDEQVVKVSSRVGAIEIPCEVTEDIGRGVVSIPHGYGHGREGIHLDTAKNYAGVSINDLTDDRVIDELTGNAAFSNVKVRLELK
ncbi:MAG TPA: molybdopterin-dependent oxidoreductase [Pyrinomonadaceae bacterium]|jgi:anaerobic selenocysteine-containing dehydrogenase|nr:molybdopterin-dependent oxidoreductase [Pyrinomonadaceae bacterium]